MGDAVPDDRTLGEVVRQLEQISQQQRDILMEIRSDRETYHRTFVPRETYEAKHEALRSQQAAAIKEVADDVNEMKQARVKDADRWKQAMFAIGAQILLLLMVGAFAVSNFMARAGG